MLPPVAARSTDTVKYGSNIKKTALEWIQTLNAEFANDATLKQTVQLPFTYPSTDNAPMKYVNFVLNRLAAPISENNNVIWQSSLEDKGVSVITLEGGGDQINNLKASGVKSANDEETTESKTLFTANDGGAFQTPTNTEFSMFTPSFEKSSYSPGLTSQEDAKERGPLGMSKSKHTTEEQLASEDQSASDDWPDLMQTTLKDEMNANTFILKRLQYWKDMLAAKKYSSPDNEAALSALQRRINKALTWHSLPQSSSKQLYKTTMPSIKIFSKQLFSFLSCRAGDDEDEAPPRALVVEGPTDFCHKETRGGGPLLAPIVGAPPPYLKLAGIKYSECIQPPIMPRPDLAALGISYRRIPLLAIGRHVYCDSRLILQVLQERYPIHGVPMSSSDKAIQRLLQDWTNDQIFWHATRCLPFERSAAASSPAFLNDRSEALGRPFRIEDMIKERPESYGYIRAMFQTLESFFEDGRDWIVGSEKLSLADIDAVYIAQWIVTNPLMEGATPEEFISEKLFPKTYAWVYRFKQALRDAESGATVATTLGGKEAFDKITSAPVTVLQGDISDTDPLGLKIGQAVCIQNAQGVLIHFPRWNFRIQALEEGRSSTSVPSTDAVPLLDRPHRLFYHPLSPFSRKVYMFALELGTADRIELQTVVVAPVKYPGWSDDVPTVAESNPLAKLPTLVLGNNGDGVYDSKVICDFLEDEALTNKRSDLGPLNWRLRTLHGCAD
ncbi:hypothetical protein KCU66_g7805, partial [Aureobasidium melanogenum]